MTNNHGLPEWLVEAVQASNNQYNSGKSDYTATSLITPPQIKELTRQYGHLIEEDVADLIPSFIGTGVHNHLENLLENKEDYITEERYFATVDDKLVSAQIDLFHKPTKSLEDFKLTSVFKLNKEEQNEYDFQLNVGRYLMYQNGIEVDKLFIGGFPLDWRNSEAKRRHDYPKCKFVRLEIPVWSHDYTEAEIIKRIRDHEEAKNGNTRPCTDKERWATDGSWAVMKKGRKSAVRLFEFEPSEQQMKELGGTYIEERPKTYRRCEEYCEVAQWCKQFNGS